MQVLRLPHLGLVWTLHLHSHLVLGGGSARSSGRAKDQLANSIPVELKVPHMSLLTEGMTLSPPVQAAHPDFSGDYPRRTDSSGYLATLTLVGLGMDIKT